MKNEIYEMLVEVLVEMQGDGMFNESIEEYMDFTTLTKEEVEWYLKNYITDVFNMDNHVEAFGIKDEFEEYKKKIGVI